ncbi:MAG TPA: serine/threonine-protein kinase [Bryobacteraceae bacterium]|nr:serine/threonine-protein kinase [Bryobacteraceae bacterium]
MSTYPHQLVRRVFEEALDRPEAERMAFVEAACANNPEVLRQVKELLAARAEAGDFLQQEPERPRRIGRYVITGELGRGAMGIVYEAVDPLIGRGVAIKVIHLQPLAGSADTAFLRDRLFREARSAGMLFHPGIAVILDVGQEGDLSFIAMERVDGPSLFQVLEKERRIDRARALSIVRQTAAALDFAHDKGVVHRDIKPANIMLEKGVTVKVADFGIAKITNAQQQTQTGFPMGTPSYMSPEQVDGRTLDGRSDQFSLAVVGYELLTGSKPFQAETVTSLLHLIACGPRPSAHAANPELPAAADGIFQRVFARLPEERYASCAEFVAALEAALAGAPAAQKAVPEAAPVEPSRMQPSPPPAPKRRGLAIGIAAVVVVLLLAGALAYRFLPKTQLRSGAPPSLPASPPPTAPGSAPASLPVIARFSADPESIAAGASATLNWEASGASTLTIDPDIGKVPAQGPLTVRPGKTTTYVLTASNAAGKNTAETTITIAAPAAADKAVQARQICGDALAKRRAGQAAQAVPLFRQAADLGGTCGMTALGEYYLEEVNDAPRDGKEALRWFRKAGDAGDAAAMLQVGACYELGVGAAADDQVAATWYGKAAGRGNAAAMFNLGQMYESGRGVTRDLEKARDMYIKSAAAGNADARSRLAHLPSK